MGKIRKTKHLAFQVSENNVEKSGLISMTGHLMMGMGFSLNNRPKELRIKIAVSKIFDFNVHQLGLFRRKYFP